MQHVVTLGKFGQVTYLTQLLLIVDFNDEMMDKVYVARMHRMSDTPYQTRSVWHGNVSEGIFWIRINDYLNWTYPNCIDGGLFK